MRVLKLIGQISVSFDVDTFIEAGDHQKVLEDVLATVRQRYPDAALSITQRRQRRNLGLIVGHGGGRTIAPQQGRRP